VCESVCECVCPRERKELATNTDMVRDVGMYRYCADAN